LGSATWRIVVDSGFCCRFRLSPSR
jgi:hypothetical protein